MKCIQNKIPQLTRKSSPCLIKFILNFTWTEQTKFGAFVQDTTEKECHPVVLQPTARLHQSHDIYWWSSGHLQGQERAALGHVLRSKPSLLLHPFSTRKKSILGTENTWMTQNSPNTPKCDSKPKLRQQHMYPQEKHANLRNTTGKTVLLIVQCNWILVLKDNSYWLLHLLQFVVKFIGWLRSSQ